VCIWWRCQEHPCARTDTLGSTQHHGVDGQTNSAGFVCMIISRRCVDKEHVCFFYAGTLGGSWCCGSLASRLWSGEHHDASCMPAQWSAVLLMPVCEQGHSDCT
jgi:hypothetical protein